MADLRARLGHFRSNTGKLRARATAVGSWEQFFNRLVSAKLDFAAPSSGMLRTRATAIGTWEQFQCGVPGRWSIGRRFETWPPCAKRA